MQHDPISVLVTAWELGGWALLTIFFAKILLVIPKWFNLLVKELNKKD